MIGLVIPSRGLVFSETIDEAIGEVRSTYIETPDGPRLRERIQWRLYMAHSRPIPQCFNEPMQHALDDGVSHVWIVEEDMRLPRGILAELLRADVPFAAADYRLHTGKLTAQRDEQGRVIFMGTGCLLARADALRAQMPFRTDRHFLLPDYREVEDGNDPTAYGQHDAYLGISLYRAGTPIHVVPTLCGHRYIRREAAQWRNKDGWHEVAEY